jgi:hypothetical protein
MEKVRGVLSFSLLFHLSFAPFLPNLGFCGSLILDDNFLTLFSLWSFSCVSIGLGFEIQTMCTWSCQCTHQGGDGETKWVVP